jgi:replicative DNA helicase
MKQELIQQILKIIGNPEVDEKVILFQLKNLLNDKDLQNSSIKESKSISRLVSENINLIKNGFTETHLIPTGLIELDVLIGGFSMGELVVIAGRPAMGKSQFLIQVAINISLTQPVLFFTFDLSEFNLTNRILSNITGIAADKIIQHNLTDEEKSLIISKGEQFNRHKITINDSCNNSISAFLGLCKKKIEHDGVKVIIVDYLQMMSSRKNYKTREQEVSYITRELKNIAKDYNVLVIVSSQLSRAVESRTGDKKPLLSDLRESGAIEQDADKVIAIYRPEYYGFSEDCNGNITRNLIELMILKNRYGKVGSVHLSKDDYFTRLKSLEIYQSQQEFTFLQNRIDEIEEDNLF